MKLKADVPWSVSTPSARKALTEWVDLELSFYVKDMISDGDYDILRRNLLTIAESHAEYVIRSRARLARRRPVNKAPSGRTLLRSWTCPRCSQRNSPGTDNCLACGHER